MIPLAAVYLLQQQRAENKGLPVVLVSSLIVVIVIIIIGFSQINYGIFTIDKTTEYNRIGKNDPSMDMYGYKRRGDAFRDILDPKSRRSV